MSAPPVEFSLELRPEARFDVIDVAQRMASQFGDVLSQRKKALYCSYHTTAGYFEQSLVSRFNHSRERLDGFLKAFHGLFPPNADYEHDKIHLRDDLSDAQRITEPRNADSHLTFIGSGLRNCVTYVNRESAPVYFVDLDGVSEHGTRTRQTTVMGFDREVVVDNFTIQVPVSKHPIESINLRDADLGIFDEINERLRRLGVDKGRVDISLESSERSAGLTVNEYETLLMTHDLAEVLKNPVQFAAEKGRNMLRDPLAIPNKTINYAQYDMVRVFNELMDALKISESLLERLAAKFLAVPASRFLRMKRSVNLLVTDRAGNGHGSVVQGTYQSPILVQWRQPSDPNRRLSVTLKKFQ